MSIEAMKLALEALEMGLGQVSGDYDTAVQKAIGAATALRTAIEQMERAEPVMWVMPDGKIVDKHGLGFYKGTSPNDRTPLYTTPPAAQPALKPLTPESVNSMAERHALEGDARHWYVVGIVDGEAAHGITGEAK